MDYDNLKIKRHIPFWTKQYFMGWESGISHGSNDVTGWTMEYMAHERFDDLPSVKMVIIHELCGITRAIDLFFHINVFFFWVGTVLTQLRKPFIQGISDCPWWGDKAMYESWWKRWNQQMTTYGKWGSPPRIDGKDSSLLSLNMAVDVKCG
jgi:hypothetical protein